MQLTEKKKVARRLSEKQIMRRLTILSTARELIEERGCEKFTMRDLAERSGVALKTLYDIYGSKDDLIARAIEERARIVFEAGERDDPEVGFARLIVIAERQWRGALEALNLTKSVAPILALQPRTFAMEDIYLRYHRRAVQDIADMGDLAEWADVDFIVRLMLLGQGPITLMWSRDEITVHEAFDFTVMMMSQILYPSSLGTTRKMIEQTLEETHRKLRNWPRR